MFGRDRPMFYVEVDGVPKPVEKAEEWGIWRETADVRVAQDDVGPFWVSTVFLGLDHNYHPRGAPLIYETMVFGPPEPYKLPEEGPPDEDLASPWGVMAQSWWEMISRWVAEGRTFRPEQDQQRYSTREQALAGHAEMVERWSVAWHELESTEVREGDS